MKLRFIEAVSSKTAHVDDPVTLELAEDLRVNDVVVVREGTTATGDITVAKKAGMLGKEGDLALQLYYLKAGDNKIKLRGTKGQEGGAKVGTAIVLTVLVGVFGLIKHGKHAEIPAGTVLTAHTTDDTALAIGAPPASPEQSVGQVSLTSDPAGGEIQIDGKFFGNTPAVLALAPGEHKVQVTSTGKTWERTLTERREQIGRQRSTGAGARSVVAAAQDA